MAKSRRAWLDEAVGQIRFKPDRKAVFEELVAHIQDRSDDLVSRGYTREEADDRTLLAMGGPVEVGRQLDAVHKPWLGWLWKVSRWLAIIAVLVVLWSLLWGGIFSNWDFKRPHQNRMLDPETDMVYSETVGEIHRAFYREENGVEVKWDRYRFSIDRAALWDDSLYARLKVTGFLPWEEFLILREAYAVDNLGNYYQNFQSIYFDWALYEESGWKWMNLGWGDYRRLTTWWYEFGIDGLDPEAEWVELCYDHSGQNIVLRIDLTGGEGA